MALLQQSGAYLTSAVPAGIEQSCAILNPYGVEVRYPDDQSEPSPEDSAEARRAAEAIREWVRRLVLK